MIHRLAQSAAASPRSSGLPARSSSRRPRTRRSASTSTPTARRTTRTCRPTRAGARSRATSPTTRRARAAPQRRAVAQGPPTPTGFPRVDPDTQKGRDDLRRKVLSDELASEEQLLGEARVAYGNGAPQPLADEQTDAEKYRSGSRSCARPCNCTSATSRRCARKSPRSLTLQRVCARCADAPCGRR